MGGSQLAQQKSDCALLPPPFGTIHPLSLYTLIETPCHQRVDAEHSTYVTLN